MAQTGEKIRKKGVSPGFLPGDEVQKQAQAAARKLDTKVEEKGGFFESSIAKTQEEAKEAQRKQEEAIGKQRQQEQLRLAEAESDVKRRRFLARAGGRRSLIASR